MQKSGDKFSGGRSSFGDDACGEAMSSVMKILTPQVLESGAGKSLRRREGLLGTVKGISMRSGKTSSADAGSHRIPK